MRGGTKRAERTRGRPRQFEPGAALDSATEVFWARGFAATSLDDLGDAMNMSRPSITNAFGDKEALYQQALARFTTRMTNEVGGLLFGEPNLRKALTAFYYTALDVYFEYDPAPGCFVMCTAPAEAAEHPQVREHLMRIIRDVDDILADRFVQAKEDGDFAADGDAKTAAKMAQAILHSLAIRARSGTSKSSLRAMTRYAVETLVSAP